jgi:adenylate cyclase
LSEQRLTRHELAVAVPAPPELISQLIEYGMLRPDDRDTFARTDVQRVRAVQAMCSPGIPLEDLVPAFRAGLFTLEPIELLFPQPALSTEQTYAELAAELGMDYAGLSRLLIGAGLPGRRPEDLVRGDDADLLRDIVEAGAMFGGGELTGRFARIYGDAARRAAEGGMALFNEGDQSRSQHREALRDPAQRQEMNERGGQLMRLSEELLARMYRRHLEHALSRVWAGAAEAWLDEMGIRAAGDRPPAVAFVDLAGYTSTTEAAGDTIAARLAATLAELSELAAAEAGGRVVKLLGDGAMLYFEEPTTAAYGTLRLVERIGRSQLPPARGGVHVGHVIERDNDYFGRTVNLAARIAGQAEPGQVLTSAQFAELGDPHVRFRPVGERQLKGIGALALYEAYAEAPE